MCVLWQHRALVTSIHHVQQAAVTGHLTMLACCLMLRVGMWTTVLYTVCLYTAMAFDKQHDSLDYRQNMTNVSAVAPRTAPCQVSPCRDAQATSLTQSDTCPRWSSALFPLIPG